MLFFVLGAVFGSFANVLIYRLPQKIPFAKERSVCTSCNHILGFIDLIPILSYFFLRGRCRFCKARFSFSYPLVEVLVAVLFLGSYVFFGLYSAIFVAFLLFLLVVVAVIDFHTQDIYDSFVVLLFVFGLAWVLLQHFFPGVFPHAPHLMSAVIGFFVGGLPLLVIDRLCLFFLKKDGFGYGDVKLMFAVGVFLGWQLTVLAFFLAFVGGGLIAGTLMATGKLKRGVYIAFGPFLVIGTIISLFFGREIINFYTSFL